MTTTLNNLGLELKRLVEIEKKNFFDIVDEMDIDYEYQNENHNFQTGTCDVYVNVGGVLIHLGNDYFI